MASIDQSQRQRTGILSRRAAERAAAGLLILYALIVVAAVAARVAGGADGANPVAQISANYLPYVINQSANLVAALLLTALAAVLYQLFRPLAANLALLTGLMLLGAAVFAGLGGIAGLTIAQSAESYPAIEPWRALAGKVSFTFAGLGLLALAGLIARRGTPCRWLGIWGLPVGILMFFIWYDNAALLHRLSGGLYLLWLTALAGWLLFRGTANPDIGGNNA